jgi:hypothetical protein
MVADFGTEERNSPTHQNKIKYNDFEEMLRKFSGDNTMCIIKWLNEFEQYARTFNWDDLQKFVFCKRSLIGTAKVYIECEAKPLTYKDLKSDLILEFQSKVTSADVHRSLSERKKKVDESYREYLYQMIDIAAQASVDETSIIDYIVKGIKDHPNNKVILHGCTTIKEFKEKLEIYEKIKKDYDAYNNKNNIKEVKTFKGERNFEKSSKKKYCFNCGSVDHEFHSCPEKTKGPKCFGCNEFGHKKPNFPKRITITSANVIVKSSMFISCKINNLLLDGLVDTGSEICIIKENFIKLIKSSYDKHSRITISGIGANVSTVGLGRLNIDVGGEIFEDVEVHVVKDEHMKPDLIIGMTLLKSAVVQIEEGKLKVIKRQPSEKLIENKYQENHSDSSCFLSKINVEELKEILNESQVVEHLNNKQIQEEVVSLITNYKPEEPEETPIKMKIVTTDDIPIYRSPRRYPPKEQKIIQEQVCEWLDKKIIRESCSDYSSQVVLAKKKDGSYRLCIDYRNINKKIHKDRYPLPNIEDQIDKLQGAKFFSTLDLENGFFHVAVEEESKKFTSFVTSCGQFEFNRVPFGLCNSPAVFQKYVNFVFKDLIAKSYVIVYLDDIVIPSVSIEEGLEKLKKVLNVAARNGLKIKWKKSQILKEEIEYLGYTIRSGHISPSELKTKAVINFPVPTTVKKLQSFMGLASYFRKFIPNFAVKTKSLSDLLKKDSLFKVEDVQLNAIKEVKEILAKRPVLKIFEYGLQTELHTDASKDGYGAILLQRCNDDNELHPVSYMSKKTTDAEKRYCSYELEVLAVVEAVKKFRVYLLGQPFKLVTDCKAFECTLKKKDLATRVARWALLLEEFEYIVEHRSGNKMRHVDALSRNPITMIANTSVENESFLRRIKENQAKDDRLRAIMEILKQKPYQNYIMHNNILCRKVDDKILFVVPDCMVAEIIKTAHEKGHFHVRKMTEILGKEYYIQNLPKKIEKHIRGCIKCILSERKLGKAEGYLYPIPKGDRPLDTLHLDHLGPMHNTQKNYRYILAIKDGFTKFCWLFPTKTLNTDETIQKIEIVAETFGYPRRFITDHGGAFTANKFKEFCKERDIRTSLATVGVARGNGQVERLNTIIRTTITKLALENPEKWYQFVKPVQCVLNSTFQSAIQTSPFRLMVGVDMKMKNDFKIVEIIENEWQNQFIEGRAEERERAKKDIAVIQDENKKCFNRKRKPAYKYKINELVAIESIQFRPGSKIRPKFVGPYKVTSIKGFDRYSVEKVGVHEGPKITESSADRMKKWPEDEDENISVASDTEYESEDQDELDHDELDRDEDIDEAVVHEISSDSDDSSGMAECGIPRSVLDDYHNDPSLFQLHSSYSSVRTPVSS